VEAVSLIVNKKLFDQYIKAKSEMSIKEEVLGFHGTTPDSIKKISQTNFLMPGKKNNFKYQLYKSIKTLITIFR